MVELVKVCSTDELQEGQLKSFDIEGIELMATIINGDYIVSSRICTHKYYDLTKGHFAESYVTCLLHTSTFDLSDGSAMNPPATESLDMYTTEIKDGDLYIDIDE